MTDWVAVLLKQNKLHCPNNYFDIHFKFTKNSFIDTIILIFGLFKNFIKSKMSILKTKLPKDSLLNTKTQYDFVDSFQGILNDHDHKFTSTDIGKSFFSSGPKWVEKLFVLRNKLVFFFGLKTSGDIEDRENQLRNFKCEKGEQLGLFKVFDKNENEVILGEDDKHLNFRISLFLGAPQAESNRRSLTISTTVQFNNWFGRLYFLPVKPFHKIIVPTMLKGIINDLEKRQCKQKTSGQV